MHPLTACVLELAGLIGGIMAKNRRRIHVSAQQAHTFSIF
jgi:hypothetical protein